MSLDQGAEAGATRGGRDPKLATHEDDLIYAVANVQAASAVLCAATKGASELGVAILGGAHVYLYAAMLADVALAVKKDDWIGPVVQLDKSTVKPTDDWLMDHLFGIVFAPLAKKDGGEFLELVRIKASILLDTARAALAEPATEPDRGTNP